MKKIHLLCNAHLDPVWLWRWDEGLAETLSTFRVAASFCEEYDGFVFNHNEALLYQWVEEYEPALFRRIQKLVAAGKWRIMGGWYLQPDCVMTSGESLLAQIELGRDYFWEKFGVKPTTAINFDPFGHSRGLVQILKATGYDSYIFWRPFHFAGDFMWEGFDGSKIVAHGLPGVYSTKKGMAAARVAAHAGKQEKDVDLCLWGIGNHGGGPSRVDLEEINELIAASDAEIIHSCAEDYFAQLEKTKLETKACSLIPAMVGCYTTMVRIKQANRALENKIAATEKIMSYADLLTDFAFCADELNEAKKALAFCQFHDILPGTSIRSVEEDALRTFAYGQEIAERLFTKALFKLCESQPAAKDGMIPIMIFNPHPYDIEGEFEVGFMLQNQNANWDEVTLATVYDEDGNELLTQNEKPDSTLNLDWAKKVSFRAKAKASCVTRFNCKLTVMKKAELLPKDDFGEKIVVKNERMEAVINRKTGLIEHYAVDGKVLVKNSGVLEVYRDNEDPWGMTVDSFAEFADTFRLMSDQQANEFTGYPEEGLPNVRVVENGDVRVKIQSFWSYKSSKAVVEYTIPKQGVYLDVNLTVYSNEPDVMVKYRVDTGFDGVPYGQTAFGLEELYGDRKETVFHKWCALKGEEAALAVYNGGTHGGDFTSNTVRLSLLRTPIYSAHPIGKRPVAPHDRFLDHIDMGERRFCFRLSNAEDMERQAQAFNEVPYLISFFPAGGEGAADSALLIDDPNVVLSSCRKKAGKYILTLYNSSDRDCCANVTMAKAEPMQIVFKKHELKFVEI